MNSEEAKMILKVYRASGRDAGDPHFSEALELAKKDPALADWLTREMDTDSALAEKLAASPVPQNLKASILAAHRFNPDPSRRPRPALWAMAAGITLLCALLFLRDEPAPGAPLAQFQQAMVANLEATQSTGLDLTSDDFDEVRTWLANHGAGGLSAAAPISGGTAIGCKVFDFHGNPVSLVCFRLQEKGVVHLFVMRREGLAEPLPPRDAPILDHDRGWNTAAWSDASSAYLLTTQMDQQSLKKLL